MSFKNQRDIVVIDAGAVVGDPDGLRTALFQYNPDIGRPGVNGVFQQFLDDGSRPLYDFSGGNLIGDVFGQNNDALGQYLFLLINSVILILHKNKIRNHDYRTVIGGLNIFLS